MINNKTIKAIVVALTLVAGNSVYAVAFATGQMPGQSGCCGVGPLDPNRICNVACGGMVGSRARGDVVTLSFAGKAALPLQAAGQLSLPQVGDINLYQFAFTPATPKAIASYGKLPANEKVVRVVIASFNLENPNLNPQNLAPKLKQIIDAAHEKNPWAKSLLWVGRALPGETNYTEVIEINTELADLSKAEAINYKTYATGSASFTFPATTDANGKVVPAQDVPIDLAPINKQ